MFGPQLFVTTTPPHLPSHAVPLSVQHDPSALQIAPGVEHCPLFPHATNCPQLFVATPQFFVPHVVARLSGTHPPQVPTIEHTPPSHPPHWTGRPQLSFA